MTGLDNLKNANTLVQVAIDYINEFCEFKELTDTIVNDLSKGKEELSKFIEYLEDVQS